MKRFLIILTTVLSMVAVSACSSSGNGSGNGNRAGGSGGVSDHATQTAQKGHAAEPPGGAMPPPSDTEKKTVVFSTGFPSDYYKLAKQQYEAKHPNITIELQSVESDDSRIEQDLEKFVKTTNTAMLSGKGPDLINLDQLPSAAYIMKGLLTDMSKIIDTDPEFKKEDYFNNVLDGIKANGGIYGMPLYFFVYGLKGNQTFIEKSGVTFDDTKWTWADFAETAKQLTKNSDKEYYRYALGGIPPEMMLTNFVKDQYGSYVDQVNGKAKFDTSNFIQMMKQVKSLYDNNIISSTEFSLIFSPVQINSPEDYIEELRQSDFAGNYAYKSKLYLSPNPNGGKPGATFRTYMTIGINNKSSVKPEAWDFVKFMVSEEMLSQAKSTGFSINKAAYKNRVKELLKTGKVESIQEIGPMKGKVFEITQKDIDDLEKFVTGANYHVLEKLVSGPISLASSSQKSSNKIDQIVQEESIAYFSGQKTPEAVAELIQNRVTTVLNE
ncbi:ABC transporter substrate-binding protein [Paenibacillus alvei]|uniref:ABC transporter substrate-binding protein n=1 Tax=Paenibacillus alvei TaxID=44250 RepID=A0ABT4H079_PAEAL|nr:ABC transporter substrate-binding protein [Paenibacillus alvei]EJW15139.1 ABC transporter, solute-binding protein [Paenibacillus alvei DSM 29]MCY9543947.1 ABC transporter substrate-binding protein [Paenibacillus alvei]MCY9705938.1 ABC transporter substrate-binding protein [Paenibacillus alvei]MCY9737748.1 ABC transporter substrate-binding protein [Paenibacillus alvei]MCY9754710.1 ABC transporter substrate-binding protein [Paenibacillus alvei]